MAGEVEGGADGDPEDEHDESAGNLREEALAREEDDERAETDHERRPARVPDVSDHVGELVDRVAVGALDPEQLRELLDGDVDRETEDESLDDGPREELGDEAESQEPGDQEEAAGEQDEGGRVRHVGAGACRGEPGDGRGEEDGGGRGARRDQVAARAEHGVRGEGRQERVETGLRREACEAGVGDHLRDEQAPDRRAGD